MTLPLPLALTLGDAAGIGPEIILRALAGDAGDVAVYGAAHVFALTAAHLRAHHPDLPLAAFARTLTLEALRAAPDAARGLTLVDLTPELPEAARAELLALDALPFGQERAAFAHLQAIALDRAIDDALAGRVRGITTAPLRKSLALLAGRAPTGHTEILAERAGAPEHVMMLAGDVLRVALVTTHLPLAAVPGALTAERIVATLRTTSADLQRRFRIAAPRIAVAALNPHAGESGTMGREEIDLIEPAIARARDLGIDAHGPFPADTLFARAADPARWPFDAVACMYHDQALIPLKLLHFGRSANITLGLPFVRTSVDHGTAYDIAGRGEADCESLRYAIALADQLA